MQFVSTLNECVNYTTAVNVSYVYEPGTIFRIIVSFLPLPHKQLIWNFVLPDDSSFTSYLDIGLNETIIYNCFLIVS